MGEGSEKRWQQDTFGVWRLLDSDNGSESNDNSLSYQNYFDSAELQDEQKQYQNENYPTFNHGIGPTSFSKDNGSNNKNPIDQPVNYNYPDNASQLAYQTHGQIADYYNRNNSEYRNWKIIVTAILIPVVILILIISLAIYELGPSVNLIQNSSHNTNPGNAALHNHSTYQPGATTSNPEETGASKSISGSILNSRIEQSVINNVWNSFTTQLLKQNYSALSQYAIPSAIDSLKGALACGCSPWPLNYSQISFTAPNQTSYPAYFLAQMAGKDFEGNNQTRLAIFSQNSVNTPWMIDAITIYAGSMPLLGSYSNSSINIIQSAPQPDSILTSAPHQLANWLQQVDAVSDTTLGKNIVFYVSISQPVLRPTDPPHLQRQGPLLPPASSTAVDVACREVEGCTYASVGPCDLGSVENVSTGSHGQRSHPRGVLIRRSDNEN